MPYKDKKDQKAWRDAHKKEAKEYHKQYRQLYPVSLEKRLQQRIRQVEKFYKLSAKDYLALINQQNNQCAICGRQETTKTKAGLVRPLCVDHCHITGKVRGLLCNHCNSMLGHAKDNIEVLAKGILYLESNKQE